MANTIVFGYPQPQGGKIRIIADHYGPSSYANIGTSSGTGDVINASDLGVGGFDSVAMAFGGFTEGYTQSGNYVVKMFTATSGTTPSVSFPAGTAMPKVILQWFTTGSAFGTISTEVSNTTDLHAEFLRFDFVCV